MHVVFMAAELQLRMLTEITLLMWQNTTSRDGQIKQLVYSMENAILNMPEGQEEMVWLVDFKNWPKAISIKLAQESAYVLQRHYPERLGMGILLNPPHIFEAFWQVGDNHNLRMS
jgi:hypothetical protein